MARYGYDSYLGVANEAVWGTYVNPTMFIPFTKESLKGDIAWVDRKIEMRASRFGYVPLPGRRALTGGFTFHGYPHVMGLMFATFLGTEVATVNPAPGVYQHDFIAQDFSAGGGYTGRQLSVTIRKGLTNPRDCTGYKIGDMNLTQDNEKLLEVECDGAGRQEDEGVAEAAVFTETFPFIFYHAALTWASGVNSGIYYCDNVNLKLGQTVKLDNWKIGGGQTVMEQPFQDRPLFGGTFTIDFDNWDDYDRFTGFDDVALQLTYVSTEEISPGNPYRLVLTMPRVRYKNNMPEIGESALITAECEFECFSANVYGYDTPLHVRLTDATALH